MSEAPPGYEDCRFDVERTPDPGGDYRELWVDDEVGTVQARMPIVKAVYVLGSVGRAKITSELRHDHITGLLTMHLAPGEYDRLVMAIALGDVPEDSVQRVHQAIACWGTARPYRAVIALASTAAACWRQIRSYYVSHGVMDPLTTIPHLHVLLDAVETVLMDQAIKDHDREQLLDRLYREEIRVVRKGKTLVAPAGFDAESMDDAFNKAQAAQI